MTTTARWLGTTDHYARLRRIKSLDPERDFVEIANLFIADFQSVMLVQALNSLLLTYCNPRMSKILVSTGRLEHHTAQRLLNTAQAYQVLGRHGFGPGPGRDAAKQVNAIHRRFDIHPDDFVVVGCDNAIVQLELADRFGWRDVSAHERAAVVRCSAAQARALGSHRPLPLTIEGMQYFRSNYLDDHARFAPENARLAGATLAWFGQLLPRPARAVGPRLLLSQIDPRIVQACGLDVPSRNARRIALPLLRLLGRRDPLPDGAPDGMEKIKRLADIERAQHARSAAASPVRGGHAERHRATCTKLDHAAGSAEKPSCPSNTCH